MCVSCDVVAEHENIRCYCKRDLSNDFRSSTALVEILVEQCVSKSRNKI